MFVDRYPDNGRGGCRDRIAGDSHDALGYGLATNPHDARSGGDGHGRGRTPIDRSGDSGHLVIGKQS